MQDYFSKIRSARAMRFRQRGIVPPPQAQQQPPQVPNAQLGQAMVSPPAVRQTPVQGNASDYRSMLDQRATNGQNQLPGPATQADDLAGQQTPAGSYQYNPGQSDLQNLGSFAQANASGSAGGLAGLAQFAQQRQAALAPQQAGQMAGLGQNESYHLLAQQAPQTPVKSMVQQPDGTMKVDFHPPQQVDNMAVGAQMLGSGEAQMAANPYQRPQPQPPTPDPSSPAGSTSVHLPSGSGSATAPGGPNVSNPTIGGAMTSGGTSGSATQPGSGGDVHQTAAPVTQPVSANAPLADTGGNQVPTPAATGAGEPPATTSGPSATPPAPATTPSGANYQASEDKAYADARDAAQIMISQHSKEAQDSAASFLSARGISNSGASVRAMELISRDQQNAWAQVEMGLAMQHAGFSHENAMQQHEFENQTNQANAQRSWLTGERLSTQDFQSLMQNKGFTHEMDMLNQNYDRQYGKGQTMADFASSYASAREKFTNDQRLSQDDWEHMMSGEAFSHQSSLLSQQIFGEKDLQKSAQNFQMLITQGSNASAVQGYKDMMTSGQTLTADQQADYQNASKFQQYEMSPPKKGTPEYDDYQKLVQQGYGGGIQSAWKLNNLSSQMEFNRQLAMAKLEMVASSESGAGSIDDMISNGNWSGLDNLFSDWSGGGVGNGPSRADRSRQLHDYLSHVPH